MERVHDLYLGLLIPFVCVCVKLDRLVHVYIYIYMFLFIYIYICTKLTPNLTRNHDYMATLIITYQMEVFTGARFAVFSGAIGVSKIPSETPRF